MKVSELLAATIMKPCLHCTEDDMEEATARYRDSNGRFSKAYVSCILHIFLPFMPNELQAPFSPAEKALVLSSLVRDGEGTHYNIAKLVNAFRTAHEAEPNVIKRRSAKVIQDYLDNITESECQLQSRGPFFPCLSDGARST